MHKDITGGDKIESRLVLYQISSEYTKVSSSVKSVTVLLFIG